MNWGGVPFWWSGLLAMERFRGLFAATPLGRDLTGPTGAVSSGGKGARTGVSLFLNSNARVAALVSGEKGVGRR